MKTRDPYFDNLKAILILLVVFGHFTHLNRQIPVVGAISNVIYTFHMPLFIFVSGYLSKTVTAQRSKEIDHILFPYFVFQLLNYFYTKLTGLGEGTANLFLPVYQNWYLLALFIWRTAVPYFNFFSKRFALFLAVILTFVAGFFDEFSPFLALYRSVYFLPFFLIGYYFPETESILPKLPVRRVGPIAVSLLAMTIVFVVSVADPRLNDQLSYAFTPYSNYEGSVRNFFLRLTGFFSAAVISAGVLLIIPRRHLMITRFGERTLTVFLVHMFLVYPLNRLMSGAPVYQLLPAALIASGVICFLLSARIADSLLAPLMKREVFLASVRRLRKSAGRHRQETTDVSATGGTG